MPTRDQATIGLADNYDQASFQQNDTSRLLIPLCLQHDKIDAASDGLADFISTVPMGGAGSCPIEPGGLVAQVKLLDDPAERIVNRNRHLRRLAELIGNPRLRVEGVGIVLKQSGLFRDNRVQEAFEDSNPASEERGAVVRRVDVPRAIFGR